eukprot:2035222-Pleurochrysis_carterae.AAC.1
MKAAGTQWSSPPAENLATISPVETKPRPAHETRVPPTSSKRKCKRQSKVDDGSKQRERKATGAGRASKGPEAKDEPQDMERTAFCRVHSSHSPGSRQAKEDELALQRPSVGLEPQQRARRVVPKRARLAVNIACAGVFPVDSCDAASARKQRDRGKTSDF